MELMMNRIGWRFAGTRGGRLVFRRGQEEISFKSWEEVRAFALARGRQN